LKDKLIDEALKTQLTTLANSMVEQGSRQLNIALLKNLDGTAQSDMTRSLQGLIENIDYINENLDINNPDHLGTIQQLIVDATISILTTAQRHKLSVSFSSFETMQTQINNNQPLFVPKSPVCDITPLANPSNTTVPPALLTLIESHCEATPEQAAQIGSAMIAMVDAIIQRCGTGTAGTTGSGIDDASGWLASINPLLTKMPVLMIEQLMTALSGVNWHSQIGYLSECLKEIMKTTTTTPAPTTTPVPPIPGTTSHVEICHIGQSVDGPPPSIPRATMQFIQVFCGVTQEQAEAIATIITVALNATLTQCTLQELGSSSKSLRDLEYVVKQSLQMLGKWPFDAKQMGNPFPLDVIVNILDPMMTSLLPYWREFIVSLVMCIDQQHPHSPGITSYGATPSPPHVSTLASSYATQGSSMAMMTMMINDRSKPDPTIPGYLVTSSNTTNVSSLLGTAGQEGNEKMDTTWTRLNEKIDAVTMGLGVGLGIPLGLGLITIAILLYRLVTAQQAGELAEVTAGGQETGTTSTRKPTVIATLVFA